MRADYVIVGAGSAGCVLANRLSEDPSAKVILIEAGGSDRSPYIHIPAGFMKLLDHPTFTWGFHAEPDAGTAGRAILYPRGKVLGGSSSINGLIYIRGQPEDYDHWAQLGNRGWSWDDCLPYFRKAERWEGEESEVRGKGGPLFTSRMDRPPLCQTVIEAGKEIGLEYREDVNNLPPGAGDSIGWCQQTRGGRRRASTARTYLRPALKRPNLQLVTNALVHRVLFEGKRAVGVEFSRGGGTERAEAAREVILSAGAVGSPHLLQISGVGDPEHLGRIGVPVIHELRGVGKNMQDHYVCRMTYPIHGARTANERARGLPLAAEIVRYLVTGKGMLTYSASLVRRLGQGAGGIGDARCAMLICAGQLQGRPDRPARRGTRADRRLVADAALVARLCRGEIARPAGRACDQPALSLGGGRPARGDRGFAFSAPHLRGAGFGALCRTGKTARRAGAERRRAARLRAAQRQYGLPRELHLHDGAWCNVRRRQRIAGARARTSARHRRLGDAVRDLDKYQCADHHDRRKRRRHDPTRRASDPPRGYRQSRLTAKGISRFPL